MSYHATKPRQGISLMEVLISIGVISLGIFGVATLIPVAQFQVAKGTMRDRVAALGQSAVSEFRIREMGDPDKWIPQSVVFTAPDSNGQKKLIRRGFCLDPNGIIFNAAGGISSAANRFPFAKGNTPQYKIGMPKVTLHNGLPLNNVASGPMLLAVADEVFTLRDDLNFDRPTSQDQQPNRQFTVDANGHPLKTVANAAVSWFATITPTESALFAQGGVVTAVPSTNEFILSIVLVKERLRDPTLILLDEGAAVVQSEFAGEVRLTDLPSTEPNNFKVTELQTGDWLMLVKQLPNTPNFPVYRWTQIIGADDQSGPEAVAGTTRTFTIGNDDFFKPDASNNPIGNVVFVRGVQGVVERFIRLENSTAWD